MEKTFALNVKGTLDRSRFAAAPLAGKHGVTVNTASMAHRRGGPGSSIDYAAAKARGSMTLGVARESDARHPRAVDLARAGQNAFSGRGAIVARADQAILNDVPMQRFGEPEEIGELVLFICSDACEFMTADTVYVNGGGGWR